VQNDSIYVSGKTPDGACYWVNGKKTDLSSYFILGYSEISSIKYVNNTLYLADRSPESGYWIDNKRYVLGYNCMAFDIEINHGDVYVAGSREYYEHKDKACYWVNGQINEFGDGFIADMYVNSNIYCTGHRYPSPQHEDTTGFYLINSDLYPLEGKITWGTGIDIENTNVYVSGYCISNANSRYIACYWIDDKKFDLENNYFSSAESILVE
jgi:hypothetical protein